MRDRGIMACLILYTAIAGWPVASSAAGCPSGAGWNYTIGSGIGPDSWGSLFPSSCGNGVRQSPVNIVTKRAIRSPLPKIEFHYDIADVVTLDHNDQTLTGHGAGNYITVDGTKYVLDNIHGHTPSEHTINGLRLPLELHFVHVSDAGQYVVVGVLVKEGHPNQGIIEPPSGSDPSSVDFKLTDLIPKNRHYYSYDGSLTTPGSNPTAIGCPEVVLWVVMTRLVAMSSAQIQAFKDSGFACWGTDNTARPVQPINNRVLFVSSDP